MDMNFAIGLSQGIAWPWPIAVYLFLAGISGGAVAAAVILNLYRKQAHENTPVQKAASDIGAATILLGMVCLVLDLTNPFNFWRIPFDIIKVTHPANCGWRYPFKYF